MWNYAHDNYLINQIANPTKSGLSLNITLSKDFIWVFFASLIKYDYFWNIIYYFCEVGHVQEF